jgi:hypothetical protein
MMQITLNQQGSTSVLEVIVSGKLTHEAYELFRPRVEEMIRSRGRIRVLFDLVDIQGWEIPGAWDLTKCATEQFSHISRVAMVGSKAWERGLRTFCSPFTRAEIHYFDKSEMPEARAWLEQPRKEMLSDAALFIGSRT